MAMTKEERKDYDAFRYKMGDLKSGKHKKDKPKKPDSLRFVSIDGEAFISERYPESYYGLLTVSDISDTMLYQPRPLRTLEIFDFITRYGRRDNRRIMTGYGLGYDFDNWLRDIPDKLYYRFEQVDDWQPWQQGWEIKYIRNRILQLRRPITTDPKKNDHIWWIQDTIGYFQSSFVDALTKWGVDKLYPEQFAIIVEGKKHRGDFTEDKLEEVKIYNRAETDLHTILMNMLYRSALDAFEEVGLGLSTSHMSWYGPGSLAAQFLKQTDFIAEHPWFTKDPDLEAVLQGAAGPDIVAGILGEDYRFVPFSVAYSGGRIESAAVGDFV